MIGEQNPIILIAFKAGMSIKELAKKAEIKPNRLYRHAKRNQPLPDSTKLGMLREVAMALDCDLVIEFRPRNGNS